MIANLNKSWLLWAWVVFVMHLFCACALQQHLDKGALQLEKGNFDQAILAYEEALRVSPGNEDAHQGIRMARREAVRVQLMQAEQALEKQEIASAIEYARRARRMPLDLEDVDLVQRIDETVEKATSMAKQMVQKYTERGGFVQAAQLCDQVVKAAPGMVSRKKWADTVRKQAIDYYQHFAEELKKQGLFGSAAIQLAMAHHVGAEIKSESVSKPWSQFVEPTCFDKPRVTVQDNTQKATDVIPQIEKMARNAVERIRERCGEGSKDLSIAIKLERVEFVDDHQTTQAFKALPGTNIKTEEEYIEEIPYTETETYTDYETRIETQERRDCAPRPGKERGCITWTEDVTIQIPIEKTREVQKIKRIKKTRPIKGPFPPDQVVTYDLEQVSRRIVYEGKVILTGSVSSERAFSVVKEVSDASNKKVQAKGVVIPTDPMQAPSMDELISNATKALANEVEMAIQNIVEEWTQDFVQQAAKRIRVGQMPQAEEIYLRMLALGSDNNVVSKFFEDRYGLGVNQVMDVLATAMGRSLPHDQDVGQKTTSSIHFPKRDASKQMDQTDQPSTAIKAARPNEAEADDGPEQLDQPMDRAALGLTEQEIHDLEQKSIEVIGQTEDKEASLDAKNAGQDKTEKNKRHPIPIQSH